jgi:hypothetical protein
MNEHLTKQRDLAAKPALEGVSRGGLFVYNWAARSISSPSPKGQPSRMATISITQIRRKPLILS